MKIMRDTNKVGMIIMEVDTMEEVTVEVDMMAEVDMMVVEVILGEVEDAMVFFY